MAGPQVTATFTANTSAYVSNVQQAASATQKFTQSTASAADGLSVMKIAAGSALGGLAVQGINKAVGAMKSLVGGSFQAAARVQELNVAMEAIGNSTGVGGEAIREAAKAIKSMGIETASAQQTAMEFARAGLKMADASKVARVAQDLAVVAGLNSTETMDRLIQATITGNSQLLKSAGISKTASQAYEEYAAAHDKGVQSLSAAEKQQAMLDMIMEEGKNVAGTYEASMTSAGKVMRSFPRIFNDIQVSIGTVLSAGFGPIVLNLYHLAKAFSQSLEEGGAFHDVLTRMGDMFSAILSPISNFIAKLADMFKNREAMDAFAAKIQHVLDIIQKFGPEIAIAAGAFALFTVAVPILKQVESAIARVKAGQRLFNLEALANPYVLIAAAVIAALAAIAIAIKYVYDHSRELRVAFDGFLKTVQKLAGIVMGTVMAAFNSLTGGMDKAGGKAMTFQDVLKAVVDILSKAFQFYLNYVITELKILVGIFQVVIKIVEVVVRFFIMLANILKVALVAAFKFVGDKVSWLLDHLGPVGEFLKKIGTSIKDFFSKIPDAVRGFIANIKPMLEKWINAAIDFINKLIDAYNMIPGVSDVTTISRFQFADFSDVPGDLGVGGATSSQGGLLPGEKPQKYVPPKKEDEGGGGGGGGGGTDAKAKALEELKKKVQAIADEFKKAIEGMAAAYMQLRDLTDKPFGEKSQLEKAFGSESNIDSVIGMYDQLSTALNNFYDNEAAIAGKNADDIRNTQALKVEYLRQTTEKIIKLMRERDDIAKQMQKTQDDASKKIDAINAKYDELDKQAEANIKAIEAKWADVIAGLQVKLKAATEAYDRENKVLQDLIAGRDQFLKSIADGVRSFVNNLSVAEGEVEPGEGFRKALENRLKSVQEFSANIKNLLARGLDPSVVRQFVEAGVGQSGELVAKLAAGSDEDIAGINTTQQQLAASISDFQKMASAQWYDSSIAQQQAVVDPLKANVDAAQTALDQAQAARDSELAAAKAHADALKAQRAAEIAQAEKERDDALANMKTRIEQINKDIDAYAQELQSYFVALQPKLAQAMTDAGVAAMDALKAAINLKKKEVTDLVGELGAAIKKTIKDALEIHSPSRVMMDVGNQIAEGLKLGLEQGTKGVLDAARGLAGAATVDVNGALAGVAGANGGAVTIAPGAVQISFGGSLDEMSASQIQMIVDESLMKLAREIRRT